MFNENTWKFGECQTYEHLKKMGYKVVAVNFRHINFELDLVAVLSKRKQLKKLRAEYLAKIKAAASYEEAKKHRSVFNSLRAQLKPLLVICEVKTRTNNKYGKGFDAISGNKQMKLKIGAKWFLKQKKYSKYNVRFDIASIDGTQLTYIENAFEA